MSTSEIPLFPRPQIVEVDLGAATVRLRLTWCSSDEGSWVMDILDLNNVYLLSGIPLITGADLLSQFAYLGISGQLWCTTLGNSSIPPTFSNLGTEGKLLYVT
jgi:hypothetical protein